MEALTSTPSVEESTSANMGQPPAEEVRCPFGTVEHVFNYTFKNLRNNYGMYPNMDKNKAAFRFLAAIESHCKDAAECICPEGE